MSLAPSFVATLRRKARAADTAHGQPSGPRLARAAESYARAHFAEHWWEALRAAEHGDPIPADWCRHN